MKFFKELVIATALFCLPVVTFAQVEENVTTTVTVNGQEATDLEADLAELLAKINNLAESGQEIPQDVKDIVGTISAQIEQAEAPVDRETVINWVELIQEWAALLAAAIVAIIGLAESLKLVRDGTATKVGEKINTIRTRWLVVIATAVVTVLSLTMFRPGEGGWTIVEAVTYFGGTLWASLRANKELVALGIKDS